MSLLEAIFRRALVNEKPLHPVDRRLCKEWIKRRLAKVYPELRGDPRALEEAYQSLGLSARPGRTADEPHIVFEIKLPR